MQLLLALTIHYLSLAKISMYGVPGFVKHFTNWAWQLQGWYYLLSVTVFRPPPASPTACCFNVRCAGNVAFWLFFPVNQIVWFVFAAVVLLLATDAEFITDLFASIAPGVVIIGNDVFHTYPVLFIVVYAGLFRRLLWYGLNRWLAPARERGCCLLGLAIAYQVTGGALLFAGAYFAVLAAAYHGTTVNAVYGTDISVLLGLLLYVAVGLVVNGVPLLMLSTCHGVLDRPDRPDVAERRAYDPLFHGYGGGGGGEPEPLPAEKMARFARFEEEGRAERARGGLNYAVYTYRH